MAQLTTDDFFSLDLRSLRREVVLCEGADCLLTWRDAAGRVYPARLRYRDMTLFVTIPRASEDGNGIDTETVYIEETPCRYGGYRPWFACPGCARQCLVLYVAAQLRCRHCLDLVYSSQHLHAKDRQLRRIRELRHKLGAGPALVDPLSEKPRFMHWDTYHRHVSKIRELEDGYIATLMPLLARLQG